MKRVPSKDRGLDTNIPRSNSLPKIEIPPTDSIGLSVLGGLPHKISIRDTIVSQAYFSTAMSAVADELTVETPLNIANSMQSTSTELLNAFYNNHCNCVENIEHLVLWLGVGAASVGFKLFEEKRAESIFQRFEPFVSYRDIRKRMNYLILILFFLSVRNVPSVF